MVAPDVIANRPPIPFTPQPSIPDFTLAESTVEDFDRLWDLARSDRNGVAAFLDRVHTNSQSFFQQIGKILGDEREQRAWFRSIRRGDELCGFVMLAPIVKTPTLAATLHLYLTDQSSNAVADVISQLPTDMTLMMVAPDDQIANLFLPLGFESKIVLTRPASAVTVGRE